MPSYLRPFAYTSYVKYAFESYVIVVYGLDRCRHESLRYYVEEEAKEHVYVPVNGSESTTYETDAVYKLEQYGGTGFYNSYSYVMREFEVEGASLWTGCVALLVIFVILRVIAFVCLRRQVNAKR